MILPITKQCFLGLWQTVGPEGGARPQLQGRAARAALMSDVKNIMVKLKKYKRLSEIKEETELYGPALPAIVRGGAVPDMHQSCAMQREEHFCRASAAVHQPPPV